MKAMATWQIIPPAILDSTALTVKATQTLWSHFGNWQYSFNHFLKYHEKVLLRSEEPSFMSITCFPCIGECFTKDWELVMRSNTLTTDVAWTNFKHHYPGKDYIFMVKTTTTLLTKLSWQNISSQVAYILKLLSQN